MAGQSGTRTGRSGRGGPDVEVGQETRGHGSAEQPHDPTSGQVTEQVVDRVIERECAGCGGPITLRATGRPPRWCSRSCRQRGYALRAAAAQLGRPELAEPRLVREVVERTITRTVEPTAAEPEQPAVPDTAQEWAVLVDALTAQLQDPDSRTASEHDQHRRLFTALGLAVAALDRAHPGGLRSRR